jgi:peptidoglycan hydrolase CwlO-like protein
MFWSSAFQVSALENRLASYESELMNLEHQVKEKEACLVSLKQDVSIA